VIITTQELEPLLPAFVVAVAVAATVTHAAIASIGKEELRCRKP